MRKGIAKKVWKDKMEEAVRSTHSCSSQERATGWPLVYAERNCKEGLEGEDGRGSEIHTLLQQPRKSPGWPLVYAERNCKEGLEGEDGRGSEIHTLLQQPRKSPGWPVVYVGKDLQTVEGVPRSDISGSDT